MMRHFIIPNATYDCRKDKAHLICEWSCMLQELLDNLAENVPIRHEINICGKRFCFNSFFTELYKYNSIFASSLLMVKLIFNSIMFYIIVLDLFVNASMPCVEFQKGTFDSLHPQMLNL